MSYALKTISYFNEIKEKYNTIDLTKHEIFTHDMLVKTDNIVEIYDNTIVKVLNIDSFDASKLLIDKYGTKPLVLNMASEFKPGGGWRNNAIAQEEILFYKSSYALSLEPAKYEYPLSQYKCIYSENVLVFMNSEYELLDWSECFNVSCIALPGLRKPQLVDNKLSEKDKNVLRKKIEMIFLLGIEKNHECLVLGALGCGVFRNPPEDVALIYNELLCKYKKYFKEIIFAVLSKSDKDINYKTFKAII